MPIALATLLLNAGPMFQKICRKSVVFLVFVPLMAISQPSCKKMMMLPTTVVPESSIHILASVPENRAPSKGSSRILGVGWYPQIEVDAQDRVHLAYVDADPGDVRYTISEAGTLKFGPSEMVEEQGAVGSFLKLALVKNEIPVLSYYQQDEMTYGLSTAAISNV